MIVLIAKNTALSGGGSVQTGQSALGSAQLGDPKVLCIGVEASAATTVTIYVSYDAGTTWLLAATMTFAGVGGQVQTIPPGPYVKISSSNAATISAWAYTA